VIRVDQAIVVCSEQLRANPQDAFLHAIRGVVRWHEQQDLDGALLDLDEAVRLDPRSADYRKCRGMLWAARGEHDKVIAEFTEAIRLDPKAADAYCGRGYTWSKKGEHDKASADFTEAVRLDPKDADAYYGRGYAWGAKQRYDKAIADFTEAIRLDPASFYAYNGRARLAATCPAASHRDGNKAIQLALKACELSQWQVWGCVDTLAAAYAEAGDFNSAVNWQRRAIELANDDGQKTDCLQRLELYRAKKPCRLMNSSQVAFGVRPDR
jgi:tetratricopeptide (TPR) repeat protein